MVNVLNKYIEPFLRFSKERSKSKIALSLLWKWCQKKSLSRDQENTKNKQNFHRFKI